MFLEMVRQAQRILQDKRGVETLEWVLIGALIFAVAVAVYPGGLQGALTAAATTLGSAVQGQVTSAT
ncbi:MAG: hypothetical protein H6Q86_2176 [candidate division NC10 bacterium]|jgi:Flp pilus assembly pilin Flp|nr:hypothetical protein [candidate division NC10 bacterium]